MASLVRRLTSRLNRNASVIRREGHSSAHDAAHGHGHGHEHHHSHYRTVDPKWEQDWLTHETHNDGWKFGERPLPAGCKRKWEPWELPTYLFWGTFFASFYGSWFFRPDTLDPHIWGEMEAKRRREYFEKQALIQEEKRKRGLLPASE
eukprot:TRINITY_DN395_c0_g1::TRINITY_DN395_c0_g1_i1::g.7498::m.7498 TRINITY_DN395_c0_g1::TRINITY_DN395_c0_g1_i1::g.7498  ORF type:complete len:161 (-),score=17.91,ESSS/PF10183.4/1.4e-09,UreE_C/PF05194.7/0.066 TRINITY_DN395_c0_g1_i1:53-496(-)